MALVFFRTLCCNLFSLQTFKKNFPIKFRTYAPDNEWFIETMNTVFSLGGDMMQPDLPNSFLKLLSEGETMREVCLYTMHLLSCHCVM